MSEKVGWGSGGREGEGTEQGAAGRQVLPPASEAALQASYRPLSSEACSAPSSPPIPLPLPCLPLPLLQMLHRKRVTDPSAQKHTVRTFLDELRASKSFYVTPPGSNDDW